MSRGREANVGGLCTLLEGICEKLKIIVAACRKRKSLHVASACQEAVSLAESTLASRIPASLRWEDVQAVIQSQTVVHPLLLVCSLRLVDLTLHALEAVRLVLCARPVNSEVVDTIVGTLHMHIDSPHEAVKMAVLRTLSLAISPFDQPSTHTLYYQGWTRDEYFGERGVSSASPEVKSTLTPSSVKSYVQIGLQCIGSRLLVSKHSDGNSDTSGAARAHRAYVRAGMNLLRDVVSYVCRYAVSALRTEALETHDHVSMSEIVSELSHLGSRTRANSQLTRPSEPKDSSPSHSNQSLLPSSLMKWFGSEVDKWPSPSLRSAYYLINDLISTACVHAECTHLLSSTPEGKQVNGSNSVSFAYFTDSIQLSESVGKPGNSESKHVSLSLREALPLTFTLELLETVLVDGELLFYAHPSFVQLLSNRVCPLLDEIVRVTPQLLSSPNTNIQGATQKDKEPKPQPDIELIKTYTPAQQSSNQSSSEEHHAVLLRALRCFRLLATRYLPLLVPQVEVTLSCLLKIIAPVRGREILGRAVAVYPIHVRIVVVRFLIALVQIPGALESLHLTYDVNPPLTPLAKQLVAGVCLAVKSELRALHRDSAKESNCALCGRPSLPPTKSSAPEQQYGMCLYGDETLASGGPATHVLCKKCQTRVECSEDGSDLVSVVAHNQRRRSRNTEVLLASDYIPIPYLRDREAKSSETSEKRGYSVKKCAGAGQCKDVLCVCMCLTAADEPKDFRALLNAWDLPKSDEKETQNDTTDTTLGSLRTLWQRRNLDPDDIPLPTVSLMHESADNDAVESDLHAHYFYNSCAWLQIRRMIAQNVSHTLNAQSDSSPPADSSDKSEGESDGTTVSFATPAASRVLKQLNDLVALHNQNVESKSSETRVRPISESEEFADVDALLVRMGRALTPFEGYFGPSMCSPDVVLWAAHANSAGKSETDQRLCGFICQGSVLSHLYYVGCLISCGLSLAGVIGKMTSHTKKPQQKESTSWEHSFREWNMSQLSKSTQPESKESDSSKIEDSKTSQHTLFEAAYDPIMWLLSASLHHCSDTRQLCAITRTLTEIVAHHAPLANTRAVSKRVWIDAVSMLSAYAEPDLFRIGRESAQHAILMFLLRSAFNEGFFDNGAEGPRLNVNLPASFLHIATHPLSTIQSVYSCVPTRAGHTVEESTGNTVIGFRSMSAVWGEMKAARYGTSAVYTLFNDPKLSPNAYNASDANYEASPLNLDLCAYLVWSTLNERGDEELSVRERRSSSVQNRQNISISSMQCSNTNLRQKRISRHRSKNERVQGTRKAARIRQRLQTRQDMYNPDQDQVSGGSAHQVNIHVQPVPNAEARNVPLTTSVVNQIVSRTDQYVGHSKRSSVMQRMRSRALPAQLQVMSARNQICALSLLDVLNTPTLDRQMVPGAVWLLVWSVLRTLDLGVFADRLFREELQSATAYSACVARILGLSKTEESDTTHTNKAARVCVMHPAVVSALVSRALTATNALLMHAPVSARLSKQGLRLSLPFTALLASALVEKCAVNAVSDKGTSCLSLDAWGTVAADNIPQDRGWQFACQLVEVLYGDAEQREVSNLCSTVCGRFSPMLQLRLSKMAMSTGAVYFDAISLPDVFSHMTPTPFLIPQDKTARLTLAKAASEPEFADLHSSTPSPPAPRGRIDGSSSIIARMSAVFGSSASGHRQDYYANPHSKLSSTNHPASVTWVGATRPVVAYVRNAVRCSQGLWSAAEVRQASVQSSRSGAHLDSLLWLRETRVASLRGSQRDIVFTTVANASESDPGSKTVYETSPTVSIAIPQSLRAFSQSYFSALVAKGLRARLQQKGERKERSSLKGETMRLKEYLTVNWLLWGSNIGQETWIVQKALSAGACSVSVCSDSVFTQRAAVARLCELIHLCVPSFVQQSVTNLKLDASVQDAIPTTLAQELHLPKGLCGLSMSGLADPVLIHRPGAAVATLSSSSKDKEWATSVPHLWRDADVALGEVLSGMSKLLSQSPLRADIRANRTSTTHLLSSRARALLGEGTNRGKSSPGTDPSPLSLTEAATLALTWPLLCALSPYGSVEPTSTHHTTLCDVIVDTVLASLSSNDKEQETKTPAKKENVEEQQQLTRIHTVGGPISWDVGMFAHTLLRKYAMGDRSVASQWGIALRLLTTCASSGYVSPLTVDSVSSGYASVPSLYAWACQAPAGLPDVMAVHSARDILLDTVCRHSVHLVALPFVEKVKSLGDISRIPAYALPLFVEFVGECIQWWGHTYAPKWWSDIIMMEKRSESPVAVVDSAHIYMTLRINPEQLSMCCYKGISMLLSVGEHVNKLRAFSASKGGFTPPNLSGAQLNTHTTTSRPAPTLTTGNVDAAPKKQVFVIAKGGATSTSTSEHNSRSSAGGREVAMRLASVRKSPVHTHSGDAEERKDSSLHPSSADWLFCCVMGQLVKVCLDQQASVRLTSLKTLSRLAMVKCHALSHTLQCAHGALRSTGGASGTESNQAVSERVLRGMCLDMTTLSHIAAYVFIPLIGRIRTKISALTGNSEYTPVTGESKEEVLLCDILCQWKECFGVLITGYARFMENALKVYTQLMQLLQRLSSEHPTASHGPLSPSVLRVRSDPSGRSLGLNTPKFTAKMTDSDKTSSPTAMSPLRSAGAVSPSRIVDFDTASELPLTVTTAIKSMVKFMSQQLLAIFSAGLHVCRDALLSVHEGVHIDLTQFAADPFLKACRMDTARSASSQASKMDNSDFTLVESVLGALSTVLREAAGVSRALRLRKLDWLSEISHNPTQHHKLCAHGTSTQPLTLAEGWWRLVVRMWAQCVDDVEMLSDAVDCADGMTGALAIRRHRKGVCHHIRDAQCTCPMLSVLNTPTDSVTAGDVDEKRCSLCDVQMARFERIGNDTAALCSSEDGQSRSLERYFRFTSLVSGTCVDTMRQIVEDESRCVHQFTLDLVDCKCHQGYQGCVYNVCQTSTAPTNETKHGASSPSVHPTEEWAVSIGLDAHTLTQLCHRLVMCRIPVRDSDAVQLIRYRAYPPPSRVHTVKESAAELGILHLLTSIATGACITANISGVHSSPGQDSVSYEECSCAEDHMKKHVEGKRRFLQLPACFAKGCRQGYEDMSEYRRSAQLDGQMHVDVSLCNGETLPKVSRGIHGSVCVGRMSVCAENIEFVRQSVNSLSQFITGDRSSASTAPSHRSLCPSTLQLGHSRTLEAYISGLSAHYYGKLYPTASGFSPAFVRGAILVLGTSLQIMTTSMRHRLVCEASRSDKEVLSTVSDAINATMSTALATTSSCFLPDLSHRVMYTLARHHLLTAKTSHSATSVSTISADSSSIISNEGTEPALKSPVLHGSLHIETDDSNTPPVTTSTLGTSAEDTNNNSKNSQPKSGWGSRLVSLLPSALNPFRSDTGQTGGNDPKPPIEHQETRPSVNAGDDAPTHSSAHSQAKEVKSSSSDNLHTTLVARMASQLEGSPELALLLDFVESMRSSVSTATQQDALTDTQDEKHTVTVVSSALRALVGSTAEMGWLSLVLPDMSYAHGFTVRGEAMLCFLRCFQTLHYCDTSLSEALGSDGMQSLRAQLIRSAHAHLCVCARPLVYATFLRRKCAWEHTWDGLLCRLLRRCMQSPLPAMPLHRMVAEPAICVLVQSLRPPQLIAWLRARLRGVFPARRAAERSPGVAPVAKEGKVSLNDWIVQDAAGPASSHVLSSVAYNYALLTQPMDALLSDEDEQQPGNSAHALVSVLQMSAGSVIGVLRKPALGDDVTALADPFQHSQSFKCAAPGSIGGVKPLKYDSGICAYDYLAVHTGTAMVVQSVYIAPDLFGTNVSASGSPPTTTLSKQTATSKPFRARSAMDWKEWIGDMDDSFQRWFTGSRAGAAASVDSLQTHIARLSRSVPVRYMLLPQITNAFVSGLEWPQFKEVQLINMLTGISDALVGVQSTNLKCEASALSSAADVFRSWHDAMHERNNVPGCASSVQMPQGTPLSSMSTDPKEDMLVIDLSEDDLDAISPRHVDSPETPWNVNTDETKGRNTSIRVDDFLNSWITCSSVEDNSALSVQPDLRLENALNQLTPSTMMFNNLLHHEKWAECQRDSVQDDERRIFATKVSPAFVCTQLSNVIRVLLPSTESQNLAFSSVCAEAAKIALVGSSKLRRPNMIMTAGCLHSISLVCSKASHDTEEMFSVFKLALDSLTALISLGFGDHGENVSAGKTDRQRVLRILKELVYPRIVRLLPIIRGDSILIGQVMNVLLLIGKVL